MNPTDLIMQHLPAWYYVEVHPLGALHATPVDEVHRRNYQHFREETASGYEPLGLFPDLQSALDHIRDLKRLRREQRQEKNQQQERKEA